MELLTTIAAWREFAEQQRREGHRVGLVPTMGALHDGHAELIRRAASAGDVVIVTSFVNPLQFNSLDDLRLYPATPNADQILTREAGAAVLVAPSVEEMWPALGDTSPTVVHVPGLGDRLEGTDRPGHFDGMASVVSKLFAITGPCRAYFGEKDFQQLAIVRQLVRDLGFDVTVVGVPTVRDPDGLALSSRNRRLSAEGRRRALALHQALMVAKRRAVTLVPSALRKEMYLVMQEAGVDVSYVDIVDDRTLLPVGDEVTGPARALVAGLVDGVRLIDNEQLWLGGHDVAGH